MRWCALRITRRTNVTENRARRNSITDFEPGRITIEMRVVVNATAGTDYRNRLAAEIVLADFEDVAVGSRKNRSSSWREDVLTFMQPSCAARRVPGVGKSAPRNVFQRHRDFGFGSLRVESRDARVEQHAIGDRATEARDHQQQNHCRRYRKDSRQSSHSPHVT